MAVEQRLEVVQNAGDKRKLPAKFILSYFHSFTKCFEYQVLFDIPEISALMELTY